MKRSGGDERHEREEKRTLEKQKGKGRGGEMEMTEAGVEIRGERWDVKHQRTGLRILCSILKTMQHAADEQRQMIRSGRWTVM